MLATEKRTITQFCEDIQNVYKEDVKDGLTTEIAINNFLDHILHLKDYLKERTSNLSKVVKANQDVTWCEDPSIASDLEALKEGIHLGKEIHKMEILFYVSLNKYRNKGIAKEEIRNYKEMIDDLKESMEDVASRFFELPKNKVFIQASQELQDL